MDNQILRRPKGVHLHCTVSWIKNARNFLKETNERMHTIANVTLKVQSAQILYLSVKFKTKREK